jgi:glutathione-independent formaldehyde dehydrogenase
MSQNRGVVYVKPGVVEVRDIADPKFEDPMAARSTML